MAIFIRLLGLTTFHAYRVGNTIDRKLASGDPYSGKLQLWRAQTGSVERPPRAGARDGLRPLFALVGP
eukprot:2197395-Prymnesium_polylepis.1